MALGWRRGRRDGACLVGGALVSSRGVVVAAATAIDAFGLWVAGELPRRGWREGARVALLGDVPARALARAALDEAEGAAFALSEKIAERCSSGVGGGGARLQLLCVATESLSFLSLLPLAVPLGLCGALAEARVQRSFVGGRSRGNLGSLLGLVPQAAVADRVADRGGPRKDFVLEASNPSGEVGEGCVLLFGPITFAKK